MTVLMTTQNLGYLPLPNVSELILSDELSPDAATPTAFAIVFTSDGRAVMANNRRRGLEYAGGHRDQVDGKIEDIVAAAWREFWEETGCRAAMLLPLAYQRNVCSGKEPSGYKYPFPTSYQQFMVGIIAEIGDFEETDECLPPVFVGREEADALLSPSQHCLYIAAYDAVFGPTARSEFAAPAMTL